jgi:hypothetical protein
MTDSGRRFYTWLGGFAFLEARRSFPSRTLRRFPSDVKGISIGMRSDRRSVPEIPIHMPHHRSSLRFNPTPLRGAGISPDN